MYINLLTIHSWLRWLVLISLVYSVFYFYFKYKQQTQFTSYSNLIRISTMVIAQLQMVIGGWLYFVSPFVAQFMVDPNRGIHVREIRFFAMEHSLMMFVAVIIISIGSMTSKRKANHLEHKTVFRWFSVALIIILLNIPWEFSPLVHRPSFR